MTSGIVVLKFSGLFLPQDKSETLVVFDDTFAVASEPSDVYYTQSGVEEAAKNYEAQGNTLQAEEFRRGLRALTEFRTNHAYSY
ncbi:hypothetical protein EKK58_00775 [Candidatus Dependentiae bacterium]|nr:MAG: hypothetical protein EKK58_00775 [Candidatus Dependentiae bacterium]